MPTESQYKRYRDGYAAGQRDGAAPSSAEDESIMRSITGDHETDAGYSDGFYTGRRQYRLGAFSGLTRVVKDVFWIPQLDRWFRRRSAGG
jgi:hypothetical protein